MLNSAVRHSKYRKCHDEVVMVGSPCASHHGEHEGPRPRQIGQLVGLRCGGDCKASQVDSPDDPCSRDPSSIEKPAVVGTL